MNIDIEKPSFKQLVLLNMQQLTNFPYIEKDFDAVTDYQLLCKVVEYLNDVIKNQNTTNDTVVGLYNAFTTLKDYVDNYFTNLDVQEEINNKLDSMAEDGTLEKIINQQIFGEMTADIASLKEYTNISRTPTLFIGDSYLVPDTNFASIYKSLIGLPNNKFYKYASGGAGFYSTGTGGKTFIDLLNDAILGMTESQRNSIKLLIVGTCINDANYESSFQNITSGIRTFMTLVNTNFPNAKVYCVSCGNRLGQTQNDYNKRRHFKRIVIPALTGANTNYPKFTYVDNSDLWLINADMFNEDGLHPNESGQNNIAGYLVKAMNNQKSIEYFNAKLYLTYTSTIDGTNDLENTIDVHIHDNFIYFGLPDTNIPITALQGRGFRQIGTWSSNMLHTSEQNGLDFDIPVALFKTSEIIDTTATIRFNYDGKLYLRLNHTDVSNVNTFTLKQTVVNKCMKFI